MSTNSVLAKMAVQISANNADFNRKLSESQRTLGGFNKAIAGAAKLAVGLFGVSQLIAFGKGVFNVTSEFQRFEAVLTNTLGSNGAAQAALRQITDFAAKTPFQVDELTGSFVKLANQGFVPTLNEMTSLGDLAAAMGKSFDQLTEAIIDAQTGEFERLKEFGIRASKQGDKVTFTFKGVKKQVDFTAASIREYILSLGNVEGVTGGMEAISKTLGGTLSNLKDAVDQVKLALGKLIEGDGLVSSFLNNFAEGAKKIAEVLGGPTKEELEKTVAFFEAVKAKAWQEKDMKTWEMANEAYQIAAKRLRAIGEGEKELSDILDKKTNPSVATHTQSIKELVDQWDRLNHKKGEGPTVTKKTGADFMFDSGALTEMANAGGRALEHLNEALKVNSNAFEEWWSVVQVKWEQSAKAMKEHEERTMRLAEVSQTVGTAMGDAFSAIAFGQEDLLQSMLRSTEQIINMFLQQSIAAMIAAAIKDPSMPFPFGKIAVAAAGIAAVKGMFAALGASAGGSGGGARSAPGRTPSEMNHNIVGKVSGYNLGIVGQKSSYRRSRTG